MFDGTHVSDCPLPCTTTSSQSRFIAKTFIDGTRGHQHKHIDITFSQTVEVTTTSLVQPTLSSLLSSVGGSMGLWLGLGVVQAIEVIINCVLPWMRAGCRGCRVCRMCRGQDNGLEMFGTDDI